MNKLISLSLAAVLSFTAMIILSASANAQGYLQNPLLMAAGNGGPTAVQDNLVEVQLLPPPGAPGLPPPPRRRRGGSGAGVAGAIIGGIIGGAIIAEEERRYRRPRRRVRRGGSHEDWCYDRYRSYRAWDNSYQPYNGRRRECLSPYY